MLKKIPVSMKLAVGAILVVSAIVFATYEDHCAADKYQRICQQQVPKVSRGAGEQDVPSAKECDDPKDYMPWWYKLVAWPEGIGGWALIATGFVIAWQSYETRKAAENAGKQLAFQKETLRPRLKITKFRNDTFTESMKGDWVFVYMDISNSGGLPAYGVIADTWIEFVHGVPPYKFSPLAKYTRADYPLNIHAGTPSGFFIPLHRKLTEEERRNMGGALGAICFRLKLTYRAFGEEVHTDDAYMVRPEGMEAIGEYSSET
jgi:hypothetical protein